MCRAQKQEVSTQTSETGVDLLRRLQRSYLCKCVDPGTGFVLQSALGSWKWDAYSGETCNGGHVSAKETSQGAFVVDQSLSFSVKAGARGRIIFPISSILDIILFSFA